jgi:hypothetical protein
MGVICIFDRVDYSVTGEYRGGRGSEVKGRVRQGGECRERRKE